MNKQFQHIIVQIFKNKNNVFSKQTLWFVLYTIEYPFRMKIFLIFETQKVKLEFI